jgi:hypothetical protein
MMTSTTKSICKAIALSIAILTGCSAAATLLGADLYWLGVPLYLTVPISVIPCVCGSYLSAWVFAERWQRIVPDSPIDVGVGAYGGLAAYASMMLCIGIGAISYNGEAGIIAGYTTGHLGVVVFLLILAKKAEKAER